MSSAPFKYERIDKHDAALLIVDLQEGLYQISRDQSAVQMKNNIVAHAALGKIFNLPTILTTSTETGERETKIPICCQYLQLCTRSQWTNDRRGARTASERHHRETSRRGECLGQP